ncbi:hypothetical protein TNCT_470451 [Trichonephila clavata]|uniref:Uncharacterized protein n=1 Tax=Trichonephila clavata TaxID=2740835 RepID=A0A8X6JJW5_TRICU|nr:hypothetical protein TNCT_470451 [Trichonephila clavata]
MDRCMAGRREFPKLHMHAFSSSLSEYRCLSSVKIDVIGDVTYYFLSDVGSCSFRKTLASLIGGYCLPHFIHNLDCTLAGRQPEQIWERY